jgi:hypothetical protein
MNILSLIHKTLHINQIILVPDYIIILRYNHQIQ